MERQMLQVRVKGKNENGGEMEWSMPIYLLEGQHVTALELWSYAGEILPLIQLPIQIDGKFYIRLAPHEA